MKIRNDERDLIVKFVRACAKSAKYTLIPPSTNSFQQDMADVLEGIAKSIEENVHRPKGKEELRNMTDVALIEELWVYGKEYPNAREMARVISDSVARGDTPRLARNAAIELLTRKCPDDA